MSDSQLVSHMDAYIAGKLLRVNSWRAIGIEIGLSVDELNGIRRNFIEPLFCFATILAWMKRSKGLSMKDLVETLDKVHHDNPKHRTLSSIDFKRSCFLVPAEGWRNLGERLGTPDETLNRIEETVSVNGHERVMDVLLNWQNTQPEYCTLGNLFQVVQDIKDIPALTPFELWESYKELELLDTEKVSGLLGVELADLMPRLELLRVKEDLHSLAVFDEWRLKFGSKCTLERLFEVLCGLDRVQEACSIVEKIKDIHWGRQLDTRIMSNDMCSVLKSIPVTEWHTFGRELGLCTLELFEIQRTAEENVIIEIMCAWVAQPVIGSRTVAYKRAVDRSGGVLCLEDHFYEDMSLSNSNLDSDYVHMATANDENNQCVITLEELQMIKNDMIRASLIKEGSFETEYLDSDSQESIYAEVIFAEEPEQCYQQRLDFQCYTIKKKYYNKQEKQHFVKQLQLGHIISVKRPSHNPLRKSKKAKGVVVELSQQVIVAYIDIKRIHSLIPLHKFWTDDKVIMINNSEDENLPVWPIKQIVKRAKEYASFGVKAKTCDEFVKWCRYDGVSLPVNWEQVMIAAAKSLTVTKELCPNARKLSDEELTEMTKMMLRVGLPHHQIIGALVRKTPFNHMESCGMIYDIVDC